MAVRSRGPVKIHQHDGLPGAERQASPLDRHGFARTQNGRLQMRRPVFVDLVVEPDAFGDETVESREQILANLRVVVFVHNNRGRGVGHIDMTQPVFKIGLPDQLGDLPGQINHIVFIPGPYFEFHRVSQQRET